MYYVERSVWPGHATDSTDWTTVYPTYGMRRPATMSRLVIMSAGLIEVAGPVRPSPRRLHIADLTGQLVAGQETDLTVDAPRQLALSGMTCGAETAYQAYVEFMATTTGVEGRSNIPALARELGLTEGVDYQVALSGLEVAVPQSAAARR